LELIVIKVAKSFQINRVKVVVAVSRHTPKYPPTPATNAENRDRLAELGSQTSFAANIMENQSSLCLSDLASLN
jgi:hypothetical protein